MEDSARERVDSYKASLNKLFDQIQMWLKGEGFLAEPTDIQVTEPRPGSYTVPMLTIYDESRKPLAEVRPIGAWIIGADWRVDLCGHLENEVLVYWERGAPEIDTPESDQKGVHRTKISLFRGADKKGWYWIEDKIRGKARPLDKGLFMDLISEVQPL
jgi:hypothetical protein